MAKRLLFEVKITFSEQFDTLFRRLPPIINSSVVVGSVLTAFLILSLSNVYVLQ